MKHQLFLCASTTACLLACESNLASASGEADLGATVTPSDLGQPCPEEIRSQLNDDQRTFLRMVFPEPNLKYRPYRPDAPSERDQSYPLISTPDELPSHTNHTVYFKAPKAWNVRYPIRTGESVLARYKGDWSLNKRQYIVEDSAAQRYEQYLPRLGYFNVIPMTAKSVFERELFSRLDSGPEGRPLIKRVVRPTCEADADYSTESSLIGSYFFYARDFTNDTDEGLKDISICYNFAAAAIYGLEGLDFTNLETRFLRNGSYPDPLWSAAGNDRLVHGQIWVLRQARNQGVIDEAGLCRAQLEFSKRQSENSQRRKRQPQTP